MAAALVLAGCASRAGPDVSFATRGGDAWTFEKRLTVSAPAGTCDEVTITSPRATVIAQREDAAHFAARVPLVSGDNTVVARCAKGDAARGPAAQQHWFVRLADVPRAVIRTVVIDNKLRLDAGASRPAPARSSPILSYAWRARPGNPAPIAALPASGKRITLSPPAVDGDYDVALHVADGFGRTDESEAAFRVRGGKIETIALSREPPAWVEHAVIYGVDPFAFGPHGLEDVTARLDDLAALGVSALWLSPVTANAAGDFGYAVTDQFRLRQDFGSEADLQRLIAEAHRRGLKVIIDFVANHLSTESAYSTAAATLGRSSPYFDFFARTADDQVAHYFDWKHLENLNYDNPEVQRFIIEAFAYWVRRFDVDGFRVDAAWGPRRRAPEFWPHWHDELKRLKPDLLLLAEAPARDPYYYRAGFDAAYDWTAALGEWAWQDAFDDPDHTAERLRSAIAASADDRTLVFRFLDNNDTGARFITRYGLARTRVAAAMLLTLPGLPSLYTGDEVGAAFAPYDRASPIAWDDRDGLRDWYRRLLALRRAVPALTSRAIELLDATPRDRLLAYVRPGASAAGDVLVLLNYGSTPLRVTPRDLRRRVPVGLIDLLSCAPVSFAPRRPIEIPGNGARILGARAAGACAR